MKNAIKYLVLGISCVVCFVVLVLMVALLCDIGSLAYPATLILPMISYALFIGGFVMFTIWAFKFSNNKEHKTFLIISLAVFLASVIVFLSAKIVNPIISAEPETEYFDFTKAEFANEFEMCSIGLTPLDVIDAEKTNEKIAVYTSKNDAFTTDNNEDYATAHYRIVYNDITGKVASISYNIDKNSPNATERFYYHLFVIAQTIDPNEDTDTITEAIVNDSGELDGLYVGEKLIVTAFSHNEDKYAYITPNTH